MSDEFRLVLDPIFPSPDMQGNRKPMVNELPNEIKYSLIFDEEVDGPEIKQMYEEFHERSKAEYEAAVSEVMRLHQLEKEAATAEGRSINSKYH